MAEIRWAGVPAPYAQGLRSPGAGAGALAWGAVTRCSRVERGAQCEDRRQGAVSRRVPTSHSLRGKTPFPSLTLAAWPYGLWRPPRSRPAWKPQLTYSSTMCTSEGGVHSLWKAVGQKKQRT